MDNLLSAIPGLAKHQMQMPSSFDGERAFRLMRDAVSMLSSMYPEGALEYLGKHRSDVMEHLRCAEREVEEAALTEDQERFTKALETYVIWHRRAFDLFKGRPPVQEVA